MAVRKQNKTQHDPDPALTLPVLERGHLILNQKLNQKQELLLPERAFGLAFGVVSSYPFMTEQMK